MVSTMFRMNTEETKSRGPRNLYSIAPPERVALLPVNEHDRMSIAPGPDAAIALRKVHACQMRTQIYGHTDIRTRLAQPSSHRKRCNEL